jgi:hypothetical protein
LKEPQENSIDNGSERSDDSQHIALSLATTRPPATRMTSSVIQAGSAFCCENAVQAIVPGKFGLPEKSYKRECQEKTTPLRLSADFFLGIQPNRSKRGLPVTVRSLSPRAKRRINSSSLWFHFAVVTAPIVSETTSPTIVHWISGNAWSYRRLVAYGFLRLSERA